MTYILKEINENDRKRILLDASCDEKKIFRLTSRRGFFRINPNMKWVVNREINSYLMGSPNYGPIEHNHYYYYYNGKLYDILLKNFSENFVYITEDIEIELFTVMKKKIAEAFLAHGKVGSGKNEGFEAELKELK